MDDFWIENVRGLQPGEGVVAGAVRVAEGKIAALIPLAGAATDAAAHWAPPTAIPRIDGGGRLLTPGLIDIHTHAIGQHVYESGPQQIAAGARLLGRYGTTCVLPTLYKVMQRVHLGQLEALSRALPLAEGAIMPGFHLEGPHLALPGAGADTMPGDVKLLDEIVAATGGRVSVMSVSPETPNILPVIERLVELGITPFITHTRASAAQTMAAIDAGARHATHFYDVFPAPPETDPGVRPVGAVEAILADPRCSVDFITDGVHVDPMAIRAALAAKGYGKLVSITDSNLGAGLGDGVYDSPWGYPIKVSQAGAARVHDPRDPRHGSLAGSALTMDRGMSNLLGWLDLPEEQIWAMGTRNPARLLGLKGKGVLEVGADADLALWDRSDGRLRAARTWVRGQCVFTAE